MEESKAAAYYDELTRKGEGAARFKQGLGFSNSDSRDDFVSKGSALPSSSSFLSSFVKASSPSKASEYQKQAQLEAIQNKLKKKENSSEKEERRARVSERDRRDLSPRRRSSSRERDRHSRRRSRSRERERHSRRRSRSRERYRDRDRERKRSRSRSDSDGDRRRRGRLSPRQRRRSEKDVNDGREKVRDGKVKKQSGGAIDYPRLIDGYDKMSPAERVKAKMKLQLAETAEQDETKGMGAGWERFEFDKDAPLDDEEIEAAEDDSSLVKRIGQSFRFSAIETRKEQQNEAAHDEAMFGAPVVQPSTVESEDDAERDTKESSETVPPPTSLLSEKVLVKQQGSWRDRARKM